MNYFLARQLQIACLLGCGLFASQKMAIAQPTNLPKLPPIKYRYPDSKKTNAPPKPNDPQTDSPTKVKAVRYWRDSIIEEEIPTSTYRNSNSDAPWQYRKNSSDEIDSLIIEEPSGTEPSETDRSSGRSLFSLAQATNSSKSAPIQYKYPKTKKIISIDAVRGTRWKAVRGSGNTPIAISPDKQGVTGSASPTLWFYLPNVAQVTLEINDKKVYEYSAQTGKSIESGIVGIPLSGEILNYDRRYRWRLSYRSLIDGSRSDTFKLNGEVYRLDRAAENALNRDLAGITDPQQKIAVYLKHGVWYELISELFELRRQQPNNRMAKRLLKELLQSPTVQFKDEKSVADLAATEEVVNAPIVPTP